MVPRQTKARRREDPLGRMEPEDRTRYLRNPELELLEISVRAEGAPELLLGEAAVERLLEKVREPGILWMFGLPCMGKSTLSEAMPGRHRVAIDEIRDKHGWVYGTDEWLEEAYRLAKRRIRDALRRGRPVTFDSTGLLYSARRWAAAEAETRGVSMDAVVLLTDVAETYERNVKKRGAENTQVFHNLLGMYRGQVEYDLSYSEFRTLYMLDQSAQNTLLERWGVTPATTKRPP